MGCPTMKDASKSIYTFCYGKLAVSIRTIKNHIRIPAKLANTGGQVQVRTNMAKVTKLGETSC